MLHSSTLLECFASYVTEHNLLTRVALGPCCVVYMSGQSLILEY